MHSSELSRRLIAFTCLAIAALGTARAQCYLFTSNSSNASLKVEIPSYLTQLGPIPLAGGGHGYSYSFLGTYTLTVGKTTQVSTNNLGGVSINYFNPAPGGALFTTVVFLVAEPSLNASWQVTLQGSGDLLPKGLPKTFPPASQWTLPILGNASDAIAIPTEPNGTFYHIDQITSCTASTGGGSPTISLSTDQLQFAYTEGGPLAPQTITITNSGSGSLSWVAIAAAPWIVLSETSTTLTVSIDPSGLTPGMHSSAIAVTAAGATNSPLLIPVTITVTANGPPVISSPAHFVLVTPCRIADTRNANGPFGGPSLAGNTSRDFVIPNSTCGIPSTATAYSLNVAVVPKKTLGYVTVWPAGQAQPDVATLTSLDGRVKSNAAIVPGGAGGAVSVFATDATDLILDINGYFTPGTAASASAFYPLTPCRVADTRNPTGPLGGPGLSAQGTRSFPIPESACGVPANAQAYSLNFAAVPKGPLGFLTAWPAGQPQPLVASLNAVTGTVTANAVIIPAGANGAVDVFATNDTDLVIDINGYFAPPGNGGLSLYAMTPCRVLDSRLPAGRPPLGAAMNVNVTSSGCGVPAAARAFVFNATVVPPGPFGYLTLWPEGETQPMVATLNALDGAITSNMAIVPTSNGSISAFPSNPTYLILDIFGFYAP